MNPKTNASTRLRDPMRDFAPPASGLRADARLILLALLALAVIGAWVRLRRTDLDDADYVPRRDMARLLGVVWAGLGVEWIRSRFDLATPGFWIASIALLPFVVGAVVLGARLFGAYRAEASGAPRSLPSSSTSSKPKAGRR